MSTRVDVAPLREAFERSGLSATDVALRMGWLKPDCNRVTKALGITPYHMGHGFKPKHREHLRWDTAERLAQAIGMDPVDWDRA
jgi:hypothetical protein